MCRARTVKREKTIQQPLLKINVSPAAALQKNRGDVHRRLYLSLCTSEGNNGKDARPLVKESKHPRFPLKGKIPRRSGGKRGLRGPEKKKPSGRYNKLVWLTSEGSDAAAAASAVSRRSASARDAKLHYTLVGESRALKIVRRASCSRHDA